MRAPIAAEWSSAGALLAAILGHYGLAIALLTLTPMLWAGWHRHPWNSLTLTAPWHEQPPPEPTTPSTPTRP